MTTLELYIKAHYDIMENHLNICREQENIEKLDNAIIQAIIMKKQVESLIDYLQKRKKFE